MAEGIRIKDLAQPVLTEAAEALLASVTEDMVVLEPEAILAAAREQAGLDDFGDMDFVERLRLCCEGYKADTGPDHHGSVDRLDGTGSRCGAAPASRGPVA